MRRPVSAWRVRGDSPEALQGWEAYVCKVMSRSKCGPMDELPGSTTIRSDSLLAIPKGHFRDA